MLFIHVLNFAVHQCVVFVARPLDVNDALPVRTHRTSPLKSDKSPEHEENVRFSLLDKSVFIDM